MPTTPIYDQLLEEVTDELERQVLAYCGKTRPVTELETATIYRNGQQIEGLYCRDEGCAYSEQCSAEG